MRLARITYFWPKIKIKRIILAQITPNARNMNFNDVYTHVEEWVYFRPCDLTWYDVLACDRFSTVNKPPLTAASTNSFRSHLSKNRKTGNLVLGLWGYCVLSSLKGGFYAWFTMTAIIWWVRIYVGPHQVD